jgi:hypothetical protein
MKVLVCGSRGFGDYPLMLSVLEGLGSETPVTIIEGAAYGADIMASLIASELHYDVEEYPADWGRYPRAAGFVRNQQMLDEGHPDRVIAFSVVYPLTPGTSDMVQRAFRVNLPIEIHVSARDA